MRYTDLSLNFERKEKKKTTVCNNNNERQIFVPFPTSLKICFLLDALLTMHKLRV